MKVRGEVNEEDEGHQVLICKFSNVFKRTRKKVLKEVTVIIAGYLYATYFKKAILRELNDLENELVKDHTRALAWMATNKRLKNYFL